MAAITGLDGASRRRMGGSSRVISRTLHGGGDLYGRGDAGALVDRLTQVWVRATGRRISIFARRLQQLSLPLRPLETSRGMDSRVTGALRLVSPLGQFGEEGAYLVVNNPGTRQAWARRVPIAEQFDVYVDGDNVLRTDHVLSFYTLNVLRLHYRLDRRPPLAAAGDEGQRVGKDVADG